MALLFEAVTLFAQPTIQWQRAMGGSEFEESFSTQQTNDGGYITAGYTRSNNGDVSGFHGGIDFWIIKLNAAGVVEWKNTYGGTDVDWAYAIQQTADGGYIVAGFTESNNGDVSGNHGDKDAWLLKLSGTGAIEWQKTLGGSGWDEAWAVQQTSDGGYIMAGRSASQNGDASGNHGGLDYWVVKLSATAVIEWQKCLGRGGLPAAACRCDGRRCDISPGMSHDPIPAASLLSKVAPPPSSSAGESSGPALAEIRALHDLPLPELLYRAQTVHRQHHATDEVQLCTLLFGHGILVLADKLLTQPGKLLLQDFALCLRGQWPHLLPLCTEGLHGFIGPCRRFFCRMNPLLQLLAKRFFFS